MNDTKDIYLVGNQFYDRIHVLKDKYSYWTSHGGIRNINNVGFALATDYNESVEVINNLGRDGKVTYWGDKSYTEELSNFIKKRDMPLWTHFMYANTISGNFNIHSFPSHFSSCDISTSWRPGVTKESVIETIECCDYTFMSDEVCGGSNGDDFLKASNIAIVHDAEGSRAISSGKLWGVVRHPKENFAFTLGAGDKFAGFVIEGLAVKSGWNMQTALEYAHKETIKWLREINEKV